MPSAPGPDVLREFGVAAEPILLAGGQGTTWRVGDFVLKETDAVSAAYEAEILASLPQIGYRVPLAIQAKNGDWTVKGWGAWEFIEGEPGEGKHVAERLAAARRMHADLADLPHPPHLKTATNPWAMAHRITYGLQDWVPNPIVAECLAALKGLAKPILGPWQVIHSDLSGNFLFAASPDPTIIDFTPKWSPAGMGEAILTADMATWEGVDLTEVLPLLTMIERELLPWAAQTRLLEFDTQHRMGGRPDSMLVRQTQDYEKFAERLMELI